MRRLSLPPGRKSPIFFFIILPLIAGIILGITGNPFSENNSITIIILVIYTAILFSYALIRPRNIKKYLIEDPKRTIIEFRTVKIVIVVALALIMLEIPYILTVTMNVITFGPYFGTLFEDEIVLLYIFAGIASLLMYGLIISNNELTFYISKFYSMAALDVKSKQLRYFNKSVLEYNKYLKRYLKYQFKDINKIFLKMSLLDNYAKSNVIRSLSDSFKTEDDKLKPLKYISLELMESKDIESFLVLESLWSKLKVIGTFLAASIPIVISIISLLLKA